MTKIYACLAGNWVCLNDDPECVIGGDMQDPITWWKEGAAVYSPSYKVKKDENSYYCLDYVRLFYKGKDYRINPIFIQIVNE